MTTILALLATNIHFGLGIGQWAGSLNVPLWGVIAVVILFSLRYRIAKKRR